MAGAKDEEVPGTSAVAIKTPSGAKAVVYKTHLYDGSPLTKAFWAGLMLNNVIFLQGFALLGLTWAALPRYVALPFILGYFLNMVTSKAQYTGENHSKSYAASKEYASILEYFGMRIALPDSLNLDEKEQYLFGFHPHAVHAIGSFVTTWQHPANPLFRKFPGTVDKMKCGAASVLWYVPWVRETLLWSGWIDAGRKTLDKHLSKGASIGIVIGGEAEPLATENGKDKVVLGGRKGFIRLAMRHGAHIVPTYTFHLNDTFSFHYHFLKGPRLALQRMTQVCIPITFGRWGTPLPKPTPGLLVAIGEPIRVPPKPADPSAKPDEAIVDQIHQKYVEALQKLFEEFKLEAGYAGDRKLEVLDAPEAEREKRKSKKN
mmetsp:Transcript_36318/g.85000  ORF Transcript_36318/g.85000 Transcript_36318/m.85000 type:complete len:374 (-) Transcript_36318:274-1395(-)